MKHFFQQLLVDVIPWSLLFSVITLSVMITLVGLQQALAACSAVVYNGTNSTAVPGRHCRVRFTRTYLSGPLIINSSRTMLDVASGAVLRMLPRADYEKACPQTGCVFISTATGPEGCRTVYPNPNAPADGYRVCLSDVSLTGSGVIDGNAD